MKWNTRIIAVSVCVQPIISWSGDHPKPGDSHCMLLPKKDVKRAPDKHGKFEIIDGNDFVLVFGVKRTTKRDEFETRYVIEIDSGCKTISTIRSDGKCKPDIHEMNYGLNTSIRPIEHGKITGNMALDSTWVINEWISTEYRARFGSMPYRYRKNDKREMTGYERICKESVDPSGK